MWLWSIDNNLKSSNEIDYPFNIQWTKTLEKTSPLLLLYILYAIEWVMTVEFRPFFRKINQQQSKYASSATTQESTVHFKIQLDKQYLNGTWKINVYNLDDPLKIYDFDDRLTFIYHQ